MRNPEDIEHNGMKLSDIITLHQKWLNGDSDGQCADLRSANLYSANLRSANLRSANLRSANLYNANLESADLRSANLESANLESANLYNADQIIAIGPIGSRGDFIFGVKHEKDIMIKTGCFWGTMKKFKDAVKKTHNNNEYAQAYAAAIVFIRKYFAVKE